MAIRSHRRSRLRSIGLIAVLLAVWLAVMAVYIHFGGIG
jgi:hypothetical protein